jgi:hypothetical protein
MTVELNSKEKYALMESVLTRIERVDSLINLFNQKDDEKMRSYYQDEKIFLQELLEKLNHS